MTDAAPQYAAIPQRALGDIRLNASHWRVLATIAAHDRFGKNGTGCYASHRKLSAMASVNYNNLSTLIGELVFFGYVTKERGNLNRRMRVYRVIYHGNVRKIRAVCCCAVRTGFKKFLTTKEKATELGNSTAAGKHSKGKITTPRILCFPGMCKPSVRSLYMPRPVIPVAYSGTHDRAPARLETGKVTPDSHQQRKGGQVMWALRKSTPHPASGSGVVAADGRV
jgi:hypothetical protein